MVPFRKMVASAPVELNTIRGAARLDVVVVVMVVRLTSVFPVVSVLTTLVVLTVTLLMREPASATVVLVCATLVTVWVLPEVVVLLAL